MNTYLLHKGNICQMTDVPEMCHLDNLQDDNGSIIWKMKVVGSCWRSYVIFVADTADKVCGAKCEGW